ncbi:ABC transporter ATP-binding protein/permease [Acholeplasma sp. OttesenSCG-928-E16]|nr:ABC transporter ATP-binding protein/permease [Acholeplasma sp. OttesenSCG-928-E16]
MKDFKENTRTLGDKVVIKKLFKYIKPHKKTLIVALLLTFLVLTIDLLPPALLGMMIDTLTSTDHSNTYKITFIVVVAIGYVVLLVIGNIVSYKQTIMLQVMGQKIVFSLRDEVFQHIESLSIGQLNEVPVGKLVTRVCNDTNSIGELFTSVFVNLIKNFVYLIAIMVILLVISAKVAIIVFIAIPVALVATIVFRGMTRKSYRRIRNNISELNAFLSENLSGMKITQIFSQEEKKTNEFKDKNRLIRKNWFKQISIFAVYRPFIYLISIAGSIMVFIFGTKEVMIGAISAGAVIMLYQYVGNFFRPIEEISDLFNTIQDAFSSAEKIFDVLDTAPTIIDDVDAIELESFTGKIEFKNVWFSYIDDEWVLKDVSFTVNHGETVAFVGATGSGKTTILSLIVRNYEIQKGTILIDGIDIKKITRSSLRRHIGQMLQDVFLFSGTIYQNIALNDDSVTLEDVMTSARYVGADSFIEKLPGKYSHLVLERGNNFSTGQRQLISFARAITYKPSLMILDEATANIDSETEEIIQESLKKMMNISTMLIVAHRLSTIQHSDKIIVMQKGEIKEMGSHQELLKKEGIYYSLYELQYDEKNE